MMYFTYTDDDVQRAIAAMTIDPLPMSDDIEGISRRTQVIDQARGVIARVSPGWFGRYRLTDGHMKTLERGLMEARSLDVRVQNAVKLLAACDTSIPAERRAALTRVRETLEGEG